MTTALRHRCPGVLHLSVVLIVAVLLIPTMGRPSTAAGASVPEGQWPLLPPAVVKRFDPPALDWQAGHRGVDLAAAVGAVVMASVDGRVSFAGFIGGKGVVTVDHGSVRTTYEPVSATVSAGDEVAAGQAIGTVLVGPSHCAPAACLHWGLIRNADDVYLDPLSLLGVHPIRLLPLHGPPVPLPRQPALRDSPRYELLRLIALKGLA
jgi:murein DD-endopeptidase MepM/ murein hydrolase activator NlpD